MGAKTDQAKGRLKKAAGRLTKNEKLEREGDLDLTAGKAREIREKVKKAEAEIAREDDEDEVI